LSAGGGRTPRRDTTSFFDIPVSPGRKTLALERLGLTDSRASGGGRLKKAQKAKLTRA
jgi:hypothetical protein